MKRLGAINLQKTYQSVHVFVFYPINLFSDWLKTAIYIVLYFWKTVGVYVVDVCGILVSEEIVCWMSDKSYNELYSTWTDNKPRIVWIDL